MQITNYEEIFVIPVMEHYLLYAPFASYVSLVNETAIRELRELRTSNRLAIHPSLQPIVNRLAESSHGVPLKEGAIKAPFFLGLVTTRNCNMGCTYCDFAAPKRTGPVMSITTAKRAVDSYFAILANNHLSEANIHFFGGEPFFSPEVVDFAVNYARVKSGKLAIDVKYEVITNGFFDLDRARWIGDTFSTVILSLDGPEDIQNRTRPGLKGQKLIEANL